MGSEVVAANFSIRKPRVLCLHGFRTSGLIFKTQMGKWPQFVVDRIDFIFPDAPFPCYGKSAVEGFFDPPYYEWFQFNQVQLYAYYYLFTIFLFLYIILRTTYMGYVMFAVAKIFLWVFRIWLGGKCLTLFMHFMLWVYVLFCCIWILSGWP